MPIVSMTIGITPVEDTFTPTLRHIEERMVDIAPLYNTLYGAFRKIEQKRFDSEGPGWKGLAPSTVAGREAMGIGGEHPILNRSGASYEGETGGSLRRSLTTKGAKNAVVEPLPDGLFMGTSHPLAKYHQNGTHGAGRDHNVSMPARPLVDLNEADAEVFGGIVSDWVWGQVPGLGYGSASTFEPVAGAI